MGPTSTRMASNAHDLAPKNAVRLFLRGRRRDFRCTIVFHEPILQSPVSIGGVRMTNDEKKSV